MSPRIITVTTHLSAVNPPDSERLRIALEKLITAIYGQASTLNVRTGHTDENPEENMLDINTPLNQACMQALQSTLEHLFNLRIVIGYRGEDDKPKNIYNQEAKIRQAVRQITESFEALDKAE
ncbi:MAG TPA: hypothetical protein VIM31_03850 [Candidatus Microsaccharimonas sp.]|jgi:hypothetical protein